MLELELLLEDFEPTDSPGLSTLDPRFQEIAACIPDARYQEAAEQTQEVLMEGILDIRLIGYFVYGVFDERGPMAFKEIFQAMAKLLRDNWEALGPAKKKDKITDKSFVWLFKQLLQSLKYAEDKRTADYEKWLSKATWESLEGVLEQMGSFRRALPQVIENPGCMQLYQGLIAWVEAFQKIVQAEEAEQAAADDKAVAAAAAEEAAAAQEAEAAASRSSGGGRGGDNGSSHGSIEGSYPLQRLIAKMEAFGDLIEREDTIKASLVALDIGEILGNFDPKVYFPKLFSTYFTLLSRHVEQLEEFWHDRDSVRWQAMEQLYQVDLSAFMEL